MVQMTKPKKLVLDMSSFQHEELETWLAQNGIDLFGDVEFALLGQPHMNRREIDVVLLNKKQYLRLDKVVKEMFP